MSNQLSVAANRVVSLSYTLLLSNGELADEADAENPLLFIHGIGQTLEAFDAQLPSLCRLKMPTVKAIPTLWLIFL
jgi:FKBP-type peptidyl-prolyl cis-trans isomerase 2